jgi:hypothetical protein
MVRAVGRLSLGIVLAVFALTASRSAFPSTPARTVVHYFDGFRGDQIAPRVHVVARGHGSCWETALTESRRYSWRCFQGNEILDPCFSAASTSSFVLCPSTPWGTSALQLSLTRPLARWKPWHFHGTPWGIWTATGTRCRNTAAGVGGVPYWHGRPVVYSCTNGDSLLGYPDRTTARWTIYSASGPRARTRLVGITDAWW